MPYHYAYIEVDIQVNDNDSPYLTQLHDIVYVVKAKYYDFANCLGYKTNCV